MLNDVKIPPLDPDENRTNTLRAHGGAARKPVSLEPIPPPDGLKADVSLYSEDTTNPGGIGNFMPLGIFIIVVLVVVVVGGLLLWRMR